MKAIIIGAGVAGPAVAIALKKVGIDSAVFESANEICDQLGALIQVSYNGCKVLQQLGIEEQMLSCGDRCDRSIILNQDGRVLADARLEGMKRYGTTSLNVSRHLFHHKLVLLAREEFGIRIEFGKKLVDLKQDDGGVRAIFQDGSSEEGDFLIGCDGIHSKVRNIIFPHVAKPTYTGLIGIGGFAKVTDKTRCIPKDSMSFIFGNQGFFGYASVSKAPNQNK